MWKVFEIVFKDIKFKMWIVLKIYLWLQLIIRWKCLIENLIKIFKIVIRYFNYLKLKLVDFYQLKKCND